MTDIELAQYRLAIKKSILHYLCDDWNNHKRGRAHKENQAIFDRKEGYAIFSNTDLEMVMEKVVKSIWSVNIDDIKERDRFEQPAEHSQSESNRTEEQKASACGQSES